MLEKKLSICIPTYNRADCLRNCLESITFNDDFFINQIEICISNNGSTDSTEKVINEYEKRLPIIRWSNKENIGIPRNFLKVVSMSNSDFVWLIGDDDLLLPDTLKRTTGPNKARKDSYSALVLGNWMIKIHYDMFAFKEEKVDASFVPMFIK